MKGTPSKKPRPAEFQRTPLPIPRRTPCPQGSPLLGERWYDACATPQAHVALTPHLAPSHIASPKAQGAGMTAVMMSPLSYSASLSSSTPASAAIPAQAATPLYSTPSYCPALPCSSPSSGSGKAHRLSFCSTPSNALQKAACFMSTPTSKIITVSTPLRPCSRLRHKEILDDVNQAVEEQSVPLLRAALQRRHACPGEHALHEAVRQAHLGAMRLLLQGLADPNARCLSSERGCQFPLQLAVTGTGFARESERLQAVEMLLCAGAALNVRRTKDEENTPLHDAVRRGDFEIASMLLRHGADPNAPNGFNETPLHLVMHQERGFIPVASLRAAAEALLVAGASPLCTNGSGLLPVEAAADPELRLLLSRWTGWWRCRTLAWVHSRGSHPFRNLMPDVLMQVARFL